MPARRFHITGLVQGVFFRAETQKKAQEIGITGWARNCDDGSVEIHAEGAERKLHELEMWAHKGPPAARVDDILVTDVPEEHLQSFTTDTQ